MRQLTCFFCLSLILAACTPLTRTRRSNNGGSSSSGSDEAAYTSQCRGDFGATRAANHFEAFMMATYEFHGAAMETQRTLLDACVAMGTELGMPAAQLAGDGPEGTRTVCEAVQGFLQTEMAAIGEGSEREVEVRTTPARCEARFDVYAECAAACEVDVTPAQVELNCTGGEIRGGCSGECSGSCAVDVTAECTGVCEGACDGTCSARAADGSCAGQCDGACNGRCVTDASASCQGECRGSCSVEWERPVCTGRYEPAQIDAECQAACEARVDATLECTPASAELIVTGEPDPETEARRARVHAAIAAGMGQILTVRARVERLQRSGRRVVGELQNVPEAIRTVGVGAAACSAGAVADLQSSLASVTVTAEVSVSVSASVSAGG
ncbi:MAG: hypothetical protein AB8I08_25770 [Sandaracinaceae bacterium]